MKKIRIFSLVLLLVLSVVMLSSCNLCDGEEKTFYADSYNFSIVLTEDFKEIEVDKCFFAAQHKFLFEDVTVAAQKITIYGGGTPTLSYVVDSLESQYEQAGFEVTNTGYNYIETQKSQFGIPVYLYGYIVKNGSSFYLVEFACLEKDKDQCKPYFEDWAASISFNR